MQIKENCTDDKDYLNMSKTFIKNGETEKAIQQLLVNNPEHSESHERLILLSNQLAKLSNDNILGILTHGEFSVLYNKISTSTLQIINAISENSQIHPEQKNDIDISEFLKENPMLSQLLLYPVFIILYLIFSNSTWSNWHEFTFAIYPFISLALLIGLFISTLPFNNLHRFSISSTIFVPISAFVISSIFAIGGKRCYDTPPTDAEINETKIAIFNAFLSTVFSFIFGFFSYIGTTVGVEVAKWLNAFFTKRFETTLINYTKNDALFFTINKTNNTLRSISLGGLIVFIICLLCLLYALPKQ